MRWRRLVCALALLCSFSGLAVSHTAAAGESVQQAVYEAERERPQPEVHGVWGNAVTSLAFARRVYWLFPVEGYGGLDASARRAVDEWVAQANRRIQDYRAGSDDSLIQLGLPVDELAALVVRNEGWEVRLDRLQFALNPADCRYYLVVRPAGGR